MEYVFVSSWSHGDETGGIRQYSFDSRSGEMKYIRTFNEEKSCGVSYIDGMRGIMYVLNESDNLGTMRVGGGGEILTYRLDRETGGVELIAATPTFSPNPCQFSLDATGNYMVVANHGGRSHVTKIRKDAHGRYRPEVLFDDGAVELFKINNDGSVGELLDVVIHTGSGPKPRQISPHPHSAARSPSGKWFAVCDKGTDEISFYQINREQNRLVLCPNKASAPPGFMPRYCLFHPTKPFFYHNGEGSLELAAYRYDEEGNLEHIGTYDARMGNTPCVEKDPEEQQGLCMDRGGQYLYDVLRGPNQVAVFRVDQENGALTLIQNQTINHAWPRGALLSPDGRFLLVTCLKGEKIVVLRVREDGTLVPTGFEYDQPCAAYASFWNI